MKRALCIGINNYPGTGMDLRGCVNDARDWAAVLEDRGYGVTQLLDGAATRAAMVVEIRDLVRSLMASDIGVITYSGHGTWVPDRDGDETDGRDEALCPWDIGTDPEAVLTDDELSEIFGERRWSARLILISDSCHSGSVSRLAPVLGHAERGAVRFLPPAYWLTDEDAIMRARSASRVAKKGKPRRGGVTLSGCRDFEYSYDAFFAGRPNGAFSRVALDALAALPESATYRDWHHAIRAKLPSIDYPQTPQLTATVLQRGWTVFGE